MDVSVAQENYIKTRKHHSDLYDAAKDDLYFLSDEEFSQWDGKDVQYRIESGRPVIQIDLLNQYVHQVANDIRMNTPTINPIPATGGDKDTAEILKGLIRDIEYKSNADNAYDCGANNAVKCSLGWIRVDHDYEDDTSPFQVLKIKRVINPLSAYLDAGSVEPDGSDAMEGWILETLTGKDFKRKYPGKSPVSFGEDDETEREDEESVTIAEYFKIEEESRKVAFIDGEIVDFADGMEAYPNRVITERKVKRYIISGADVLEEGDFPGKYIPLVPVYGEEDFVDGKRKVYSLIRKSKTAQKMFNFWKATEAELLMRQPKAKFMAAEGQTDDYADDYINPDKAAVLTYKTTDLDGNPVSPPIPIPPPMPPTGVINALQMAASDVQATLGIYGAGVGDRTNEVSGVAIDSRKLESDVATYHFGDNLIKSITHVGKILVCAIPQVYDTGRIIRIIGKEDKPEEVGVNGEIVDGQERDYDLRKGEYDVRVITGAPFTTRRQEAAQFFENVLTRSPQLMSVMGDLMFENSDIEGAEQMAERLKKTMDPSLFGEENQDPQVMQLTQALQQAQQQMQGMQAELESKQVQQRLDQQKSQIELEKAKIDAEVKLQELAVKQEELAYERARLSVENAALHMQPNDIATTVTI